MGAKNTRVLRFTVFPQNRINGTPDPVAAIILCHFFSCHRQIDFKLAARLRQCFDVTRSSVQRHTFIVKLLNLIHITISIQATVTNEEVASFNRV